jgi:hypothetical protein
LKTYVAIVQDHSGSMGNLARKAMDDYNLMLDGIKDSSSGFGNDTFVSIVECGVGAMGSVRVTTSNVAVERLTHHSSYSTSGGSTPLFDSVGAAIQEASRGYDSDAAYLVLVITDGHENSSKSWNAGSIATKIAELQKTDKWTFAFRVPRGGRAHLERLGIPAGNILEWEQNEESLAKSTEQTVTGIRSYFQARSSGITSQKAFYANVADVPREVISAALVEVNSSYREYYVPPMHDGMKIQDFCEKWGPGEYSVGKALYQLTKAEKVVQDYKTFCIRDRTNGKMYSGSGARRLLGLPTSGNIQLVPGRFGNYDLFIQSNSVNRKLVGGTSILYKK